MKQILITGASGFIGGYLCDWFSRQGDRIIASSRRWPDALQTTLSGCQQITWDILSPSALPAADVLIHTATANDIDSRDPAKGLLLSGLGTRNVLEAAAQAGIPKVIVFSTFQVYGTELVGHIDESTSPAPRNDYGVNHLVAEEYAAMASRLGQVQTVSVRPSNVYGRFAVPTVKRWTLVPGCFCKEAFETGRITLRSSGRQARNFVSLENVARACAAITSQFPAQYEVYNIASSWNDTILSVAHQVARLFETRFGRPVILNIESEMPDDTNQFTVNQDKLKALGFVEDVSHDLETEIQAIFDWLEQQVPV